MLSTRLILVLSFLIVFTVLSLAQVDTAWIRYYNGPGYLSTYYYDTFKTLAVDDSGNVCVTGSSYGNDVDYATIKYKPNGDTAWVRRYNGVGGNYWDEPFALVTDAAGNVYVTGESPSFVPDYDCATIKYKPNGDTAWVRRYDGPGSGIGNDADAGYALALDNSGNLYVAGTSMASGTSQDFLTIKYASNGSIVWVKDYNGPDNNLDEANAIALDDSGNVFVAGISTTTINPIYNFLTIKYKPNGDTAWVRRYSGSNSYYSGAGAVKLAVDDSGNAYVTGLDQSNGGYGDYATIKYKPNGDTAWVKRYNGSFSSGEDGQDVNLWSNPGALKLDSSGNVYVADYSVGSSNAYDYITLKYNSIGDTVWTARYGDGCCTDQAFALQIGQGGNAYVTGFSGYSGTYDYATIRYEPNGDTAWVRRYNGPAGWSDYGFALAIDPSGNTYVTGYTGGLTGDDYATIKYNPSGDTQWVRSYNGPTNSTDEAKQVLVDDSGNVYVTGFSFSATEQDITTIKYAPNGDTLWVRRYDGPDTTSANGDFANDLWVDAEHNVYVTGISYGGSATGNDCVTIKYAPNGDTLWVRRFNNSVANSTDNGRALFVDDSGDVYVALNSRRLAASAKYADIVTIKYSPAGDSLWAAWYNGPGDSTDIPLQIKVDTSGNVYVGGYSPGATLYNDFVTIKYQPSGDTAWVRRYDGPSSQHDELSGMAIDDSGYVYVKGRSYDVSTGYDIAVIKYAPNGDTIWVRRYNGRTADNMDKPNAVAVDASRNVYVTGSSAGSGTGDDYATIKYKPNGDTAWVRRYNKLGTSYDDASDLALDIAGNVYVTGISDGEFTTIKYSPSGNALWTKDNVAGAAYGSGVALDLSGNVYVSGHYFVGLNDYNIATIKYSSTSPCTAKPGDANASGTYALGDIISIVNYIFNKPGCSPLPLCWLSNLLCRGDWNGDNSVGLTDVIRGVNFLFNKPGGPWNAVPVGVCCQ